MLLDSLDIGHLRLLCALLEHRSVIGAARALDLPQPTVSRRLAFLRDYFHDPLFVRTKTGMQPTPAALACAEPVGEILRIHRTHLLAPTEFDPAASDRQFNIAASDFGHLLVIPPFYRWARQAAPHARFSAVPLGRKSLIAQLEAGEVDVAVGGFPGLYAGVREQTLYQDGYVCACRYDSQLLQKPFTFEAFRDARHVVVQAQGLGHVHQSVEQRLQAICSERHAKITTESFVTAALLLQTEDLVLTVPARVAELFQEQQGLVLLRPPPELELPHFKVKQYWHERFDNDQENQWLRRNIARLTTGSIKNDGKRVSSIIPWSKTPGDD